MEPFTMMLGYGLVNSISQLVVRPIADKLGQNGRREDMLFQMKTKQKLDMESVRLNKQIELENAINIQKFSHQCRIAEAKNQYQNQLQMWELGQFNSSMWPLRTPFNHPSLNPQLVNGCVPMNIFMAKTDPQSPFAKLLQSDVNNRLSNFLQTTYANSPEHPCVCRIGDWKDGFQDAAFINALWFGMQGQPCIVINPIQSEFGEQLDLNVSIWGLASNTSSGCTPITENVISGPFGSAIGRFKREETKKWKMNGLPSYSQQMKHNLEILEQEEKLRSEGVDQEIIDSLLLQYHLPPEIQNNVINDFSKEYSLAVACITGMYADIYHLMEYGTQPYMPLAINQYNRNSGIKYQIPEIVASNYRKALTNLACTNYLQNKLPYAYISVADALKYDKIQSMEIFQEGVGLWANRKINSDEIVELPENIDSCIGLLRDKCDGNDEFFIEKSKKFLMSIGEEDAAKELGKISLPMPQKPKEQKKDEKKDLPIQISTFEVVNPSEIEYWISSNLSNALKYGSTDFILINRNKRYLILAFVNEDADFVFGEQLNICCMVAGKYELSGSKYEGDFVSINLNNIEKSKTLEDFMQKKSFDSFEKLGKQLDALVNNLKRGVDRTKSASTNEVQGDFLDQLTKYFSSNSEGVIETATNNVAEFSSIKKWVESKTPVENANKAHVVKTSNDNKMMLCVFFSDASDCALISSSYPMLRIYADSIDSDLEVFLNGLTIGTIKL